MLSVSLALHKADMAFFWFDDEHFTGKEKPSYAVTFFASEIAAVFSAIVILGSQHQLRITEGALCILFNDSAGYTVGPGTPESQVHFL